MKRASTLATLFLTASLVQAQDASFKTTVPPSTKLSALMGSIVMLQGEPLGKVADVVVNDQGAIDYVVVSHGSDYIAVPWSAVRYDPRQQTTLITAQVNRAQLRNLAFAANHWPSLENRTWMNSMRTVWGANAFRDPSAGPAAARVNEDHSPVTPPRTAEAGGASPRGPGVDDTKAIGNGVNTSPRLPGNAAVDPAATGGTTTGSANGPAARTSTPGGSSPRTGGTSGVGGTGGLSPRGPGVDDTKAIGNGVNTSPRLPGNAAVDPAATGGTTTGSANGPATRANTPRVPAPRANDRPPTP